MAKLKSLFSFFERRSKGRDADGFPDAWLDTLAELPLWHRLPEADQKELQGHVLAFLEKKRVEGANGMVVDDAVRVTIAAQACLLLLHRSTGYFPAISSIVVYPGEYVACWQETDESGIVTESEDCRSGEFAGNGALVLSWEDVGLAGVDDEGSYNVIIHEFAHLLDEEYRLSSSTGTGENGRGSSPWEVIFEHEYHRLQHAAAHCRPSLFDHYGAENPAEFFAVLTETFFENPCPFKLRHPELYAAMEELFRQDPASWPGW
ncbi:zinc-dependent peptidase [Geobacter sp. SVR]|uniref:M90 family metallopeptidase n=1 Tax=Geobacter sp. SVR TaxID=2495594 RepID=UPI00143EFC2B|nr:M90 family metallopeptidase [Geobacter sp. SVR]BCS55865.1 hypothetical protein GSVR_41730 [Geobacter sp. SVR]GCF83869.1 hypothetical protein GSbR_04690 [Geobacter sp. SVR]